MKKLPFGSCCLRNYLLVVVVSAGHVCYYGIVLPALDEDFPAFYWSIFEVERMRWPYAARYCHDWMLESEALIIGGNTSELETGFFSGVVSLGS